MKRSNEILNDLVSATRDGKTFYEQAAIKVASPELKTLFNRIARMKGEIVDGLSEEVRTEGDIPSTSGTWAGDYDKFYTKVRAALGDKNYAYVAELEDSEDQLLKAFTKAASDPETTAAAHDVIVGFLPEVRSCHDIMRAQKIALKKAA